MSLPNDYQARKDIPLFDFLTKYFPDAIVELVKVSVAGNQQHNPGEPLHWARGKSMDQLNTAMRHMFDHGAGNVLDTDGTMHLAKAAWRLLAEIQLLCETREIAAKIPRDVEGEQRAKDRNNGRDAPGMQRALAALDDFTARNSRLARTPGDDVDFPVRK